MDVGDVEARAAARFAHEGALIVAERCAVGRFGAGVAHAVEEHGLEPLHLERNVEQAVVDGRADARCAEQRALGELAALEDVVAHADKGRGVGQFAYLEGEHAHGLLLAVDHARHGERNVLPHGGGLGDVFAIALRGERAACHGEADLVGRYAAGTYAHGVLKAGVKHVHEVGGDGCAHRRRDDVVFLHEVAAYDFAGGVGHHDVAVEGIFAGRADGEVVRAVFGDALAVHVDFGSLRGVDRRHEDVRAERFAGEERGGFGQAVGVELVHADILDVDVGYERVEHLVLGLAHVALELGEHRDGGNGRHLLKHVLLPVLADVVFAARHVGGKVGGEDGALARVGDVLQHGGAEFPDFVIEPAPVAFHGGKHDAAGSLKVFLVFQIVRVAVLAVGLAGNGDAQAFGEVVERVGGGFHDVRLVEPRLHLFGIGGQLLLDVFV